MFTIVGKQIPQTREKILRNKNGHAEPHLAIYFLHCLQTKSFSSYITMLTISH